ncbi:23S rRNA (uracil1939-C5)-methyltransferase [Sporobacter termitidis DSM 10068]|uniref:23S rRNA (Uracil1939-C5)-methyltransferase n=1 Tax=Sporobacter termitidis DSM 10068 TaxID=1123282 RepID=A0A1M5UQP6_9FIRM|nr:23S rRNA (uracil(1939)-C(5))-methyltransferase RlmD [Sporobacter termitidis]SHH65299.1 23S rRNA (uracil1939-C5)-methyltransferase [Sporobacter termitidis DSM 10068]
MSEIKKNSIFTVTIEGYTHEGDGVAHVDGRVFFVKGALLGETAEVRVLKDSRNIVYAKIEKLLTASPSRIAPSCSNFGKCGGCDLLHMDYAEELNLKRRRVEDALRRIGGLDVIVTGIVGASSIENYRNKAIYAVGKSEGRAVTGFYRERSHDIVPTEACRIQADVSDRAAAAVRRWMDRFFVTAYNEELRSGVVRHVFCRYAFATKKAQVTIVSFEPDLLHPGALIDEIRKACPETAGIVLNVNRTRGNTVLAGDFKTLWGDDFIVDELCALKFKLSPRSFYQINSAQAEKLYAKALDYAALTGSETVLDLYCGTGTITLILAGRARRAIGAEIVEAAISDAWENAALNNIKNVEFICADAGDAAESLKNRGALPDVVVVDPPRKGLAPEVIATIAALSPARVVYVSCDPATLARDLKLFDGYGYKALEATAFDMFPRCAHVETVVLMSNSGFEGPINRQPQLL